MVQKENWFPRLQKGLFLFSLTSVLLILALIYISGLNIDVGNTINPNNQCLIPANPTKERRGFSFDVLQKNQTILVAYIIDLRAEIIYLDASDFSVSKHKQIPIDFASDLALDEAGNIYVLGRNHNSETGLHVFESTTMNHHSLFERAGMMGNSAEVDILRDGNYFAIRQHNNIDILNRNSYESILAPDQNKLNTSQALTGMYSWHPNKKLITVEIFQDSQFKLYNYDLASSEETLLAPIGLGESCQFSPSWSNSGILSFESITIEPHSSDSATTDIYTLTQQNQLSNLTATTDIYERQPAWSPDSKMIAYTHSNSSVLANRDISIIRIGDSAPQQLTKTPNIDESTPLFISNQVLLFFSFDGELSTTTLELIDFSQKTPQTLQSIPLNQ